MATHSLKGASDKSGPQNQWWHNCDVISQSILTFFVFLFVIPGDISVKNLSKIEQETKKLQKIENDIIATWFLKITQQFFVCEYFLLIPIDIPSFKLTEGQIKELQGVIPNTPLAENDQKSPGRVGLTVHAVFPGITKSRRVTSTVTTVTPHNPVSKFAWLYQKICTCQEIMFWT